MSETEGETKFCSNCKKQISANNFMMHEMHCRRHISLCVHCKEPIPKGEMEVHVEESHASIPCPKCGTAVEKMHLEDHEGVVNSVETAQAENSCPKKPTTCVYCQLEFPRNESAAHMDYCGSRTEQCPKCGQYVKLKDQNKHEDTKCRFPEVKPANNGTNRSDAGPLGASDGRQTNEYLRGLPNHQFAFDEMSRALRPEPLPRELGAMFNRGPMEDGGRAARTSKPIKKVKNTARPTENTNRPTENTNRATENTTRTTDKKTNERQNARKKSDTAAGVSPASESEYHRLLAMHLAQDLNGDDEDLYQLMRDYDKPSSPTISPVSNGNTRRGNNNTFSDDMVMIPCEFCGSPFMAEDLVQHQSGCSLDRISGMLPQMTNNHSDAGSSNNVQAPIRSPIQTPEIINNLRPFDTEQWLDDTAFEPGIHGDDLMLPCEFCCDLYPQDTLIQHQTVCDNNLSMTPRVASPTDLRSKPKERTSFTRGQNLTSDFPNLAARRQQPVSIRGLDRGDNDDDNGHHANSRTPNYTFGATHRVRKPNITAANGNSRNKNSNSNTNTGPGAIRQTMRKYGVESQDRGDYYSSRPSNSSRQSSESDTDAWLQPSAQAYGKRDSNASKTRNMLDELLMDDDDDLREMRDMSTHDLLGHIGVTGKTKKSDTGVSQQRMPGRSTGAVTGASRTKVTSTSSRDGPRRDQGKYGTRSTENDPVQPRNRTNKPGIEVRVRPSQADELSDRVTATQRPQRTRANNVFGGASNRPGRKRPEN